MLLERHAITAAARRAGFWPSIARASAQLDASRPLRTERANAGDAGALKLDGSGPPDRRRSAGGAR